MFTGDWDDNRTPRQHKQDQQRQAAVPKQTEMFSSREMAQFGVRTRPQMPLSPGKLVLVSEDPRTPEEKERDLEREAERQTAVLFPDTVETNSQAFVEVEEAPATDDVQVPIQPSPDALQQTRLAVYLELMQLSEERAATLWIDPHYQGKFEAQFGLLVAEAQHAGLTPAEIISAIKIGSYRGNQQKQQLERTQRKE
jgi:hypothetical protein